MSKLNYLQYYFLCLESGEMYSQGLCNLRPEACPDFHELIKPDAPYWGFWGYDGRQLKDNKVGVQDRDTNEILPINRNELMYKFTPLRQNIILLLAAINGEL